MGYTIVSSSKVVVDKSKFYGYLAQVTSEEDVAVLTKKLRAKHPKACHVCSGSVVEGTVGFKNDGEVGAPGKQLLNLLQYNDMKGYALVVARIFGGKKLGAGGVGRAFKEAGKECIKSWSPKSSQNNS